MRHLLAGACIGVVLLIAGCGESRLDHGRIVSKEYDSPRDYTVWVPIQTGQICSGGQYNVCTPILTPIPFEQHDGPNWKLHLRAGGQTGVAYVTPTEFDRVHDGDYFDARRVRGVQFADTNNTRRQLR